MKNFFFKVALLASINVALFLFILSFADGHTDPFYLRFTSPKQKNLIIGTSRSAQGLQPSVFKDVLDKEIYNYSFTVADSPYGNVYLNSIKKKLDSNQNNGVFIVTIDPWSISSKSNNPNDIEYFRENKLCVATTSNVNMNPNFEYLIENLKGKYYKILTKRRNKSMILNDDGWLEINIPMDSISVNKRLNRTINFYKENHLPSFKFSSSRLEYLKKTVEYLKKYGDVYLVRLPVHPEMYELDIQLIPDFENLISPVIQVSDSYLNMTINNKLYNYTDGNHLHKDSGAMVSQEIAEWIKSLNKSN